MIHFPTVYSEIFNKIIHNFLEIEIFGDLEAKDEYMENAIELIVPKYLYREQYKNCCKKIEDLYMWSEDDFNHEMSALHELILYNFLKMVESQRNDLDDFEGVYFGENIKKFIKEKYKAIQNLIKEKENFKEDKFIFYDILGYKEFLFEDVDFLMLPKLYNSRQLNLTYLESLLGTNIDYYFELLPMDIQEKYSNGHINLNGEITEFLKFINKKINNGNLEKLFWNGEKPVDENTIQIIIENMMEAYFHKENLEITREAVIGNGKVDFKVYKNKDEKLLIEIKKASSSAWKKRYENQLLEYINSSGCKNAIYLIVCFTDNELKKVEDFIRNNVYTKEYQVYVNIAILDARKKKSASKI